MNHPQPAPARRDAYSRAYYLLLLSAATFLAWVALMIPLRSQLITAAPQVGQVAEQNYRAPETVTYTSQVLTEQKRLEAERSVLPIYTPSDTNIARRQSETMRAALDYISNVRADSYATQPQKLTDLEALNDLTLTEEAGMQILALQAPRWQALSQAASLALERVMSSTIRQETLEDAHRRVPSQVSLSLTEQEANLAASLAEAFVVPNSFYSQEQTDAARQAARESIEPLTQTFVAGQTVAQAGQVLSAVQIEALQQLGLVQTPLNWKQPVSAAVLAVLMAIFIMVYFYREPAWLGKPRRMTFITLLFLAFLLLARIVVGTTDQMIPSLALIPYAFPLSAFGLTVAALFGAPLALVTALPLAILAAYGLPNTLDLTLYYLVAGLLGILVLGRARRVASFFWAGATVATAGVMVLLAYRLAQPGGEWTSLIGPAGTAVFNGLATASLTILLQFTLAQLLGMTTAMQLMDLSRPDQPLLQKVLRQAPGTYQHSLQVANLAEQAAERVGADPLLTRVGALYHDSGKATNPYFFIENLLPGLPNPHEKLDPLASAQAIIQHVTDGLELGRKHHLPRRVLEFIAEHHGTTIARYQYVKAVQAAGGDESQVDKEAYRYPGPRPQSRETAILMLADGCEARVRAERPKDEVELRGLIKGAIEERAASGQLDSVSLTLQDLNEIAESFTATLRGIYHPRIIYPTLEAATGVDAITRPALQSRSPVSSSDLKNLPPSITQSDHDSILPGESSAQTQP